jgi:hypothetical protein
MDFFGVTALSFPTAFNFSQIIFPDPVEKKAVGASQGHFTFIRNYQIQGINPHFITVAGDATLQVVLGPPPDIFHRTPFTDMFKPSAV